MDRQNVFAGEVVLETDVLSTNRYAYIGIGRTLDAIIGSTTQLNGFACTPQTPTPNLSVNVGQGEIYLQAAVDTTQYPVDVANPTSGLPPDPSLIIKQGLTSDTTNFPLTPPGTAGFSINYLIQVAFLEADTGDTSREFENDLDPDNPIVRIITTVRQDSAVLTVKAGTAAVTGTQVTPSPDAGNTGARVVTVTNGQTQITSADISEYPNAPFITDKLKDKISKPVADRLYDKRNFYVNNGSSANNYILVLQSLYGTPDAPYDGQEANFYVPVTNTGASTISLNGLTAVDLVLPNGDPLPEGTLDANEYAQTRYDLSLGKYIVLADSSLVEAKYAIINLGVASQPITDQFSPSKVDFSGVVKNSFKLFNETTNAIQPTIACTLDIYAKILVENFTLTPGGAAMAIYKNGVLYQVLDIKNNETTLGELALAGKCIIEFDGVSDYAEIFAYSNNSADISASTVWTTSPLVLGNITQLIVTFVGT